MSWTDIQNYDVQFYAPLSYSKRSHKLCVLPNGILTLLISDPDDKKSACSLSVATGSHNDPRGLPGLAHLCEHMLLAGGSKKYPDPGIYHDVISKHDGFQNAFTTGEQTTFYFEVPVMSVDGEMIFDQTLDIFTSFFKGPIFNPTIMNKEIYAITSEHEANLSSTTKILYQATRLLANQHHPFSQFSTGNMHSLSSVPNLESKNLTNLLIEYFNDNFFAERMTLCLRGPQSVNSLTKLALSKFGNIRKTNINLRSTFGSISYRRSTTIKRLKNLVSGKKDINRFEILENTWSPKYKPNPCFDNNNPSNQNIILIKSSKQPLARFLFPINANTEQFSKREITIFSRFWCDLFGDETKGSCCNYFKSKGWITECFAYTSEFTIECLGLILELSLTVSGWENIDSIVTILFEKSVPQFSKGNLHDLAEYLSDQNLIELIMFLYQAKEKYPMEEASNLSGILQENIKDMNISYIFKGSPIIMETSSGRYGDILDGNNEEMSNWWLCQALKFQKFLKTFMTPDTVKLIILGEDITKCGSFKQPDFKMKSDLFYEFDYHQSFVDIRSIIKEIPENTSTFKYPQKNLFIPSWCNSLFVLQQEFLETSLKSKFSSLRPTIKVDQLSQIPRLVSFNSSYEMWIMEVDELNSSFNKKSIVTFELSSFSIEPSPENTIHLEILAQILLMLLSSDLYPSLKLGYTYEIAASSRGEVTLKFTVSGFNDGLVTIVQFIVATLSKLGSESSPVTKELLRKARILTRAKYESASNENCIKLGSIGLLIALEQYMWTLDDRMEVLEDTGMNEFIQFCEKFVRPGANYLTLFVQGNLEHADSIHQYLDSNLTKHLSLHNETLRSPRKIANKLITTVLEPGTNYYLEHSGNKEDPNNSIVYFIQTGLRTDNVIVALTFFTAYLMSITLIPDLRSKKQIGYVVLGGVRELTDTIGIHITVMSGNSPYSLEDSLDQYFEYFEKYMLGKMSEDDFQENYVSKYLELMSNKTNNAVDNSESTSGPINLMNEIIANVQNGSSDVLNSTEMKEHRLFTNMIIEKNYQFSNNNNGSNSNNKKIIQQLTLDRYKIFIEECISIHSLNRSKISTMIVSPLTKEEIVDKKIFLQLEAFLKIKGLLIKSNDLKTIVEISKGSPTALMKNLFKEFHNKHEAWKFCSIVLKEIFGALGLGLHQKFVKNPFNKSDAAESRTRKDTSDLNNSWNTDIEPAIPLTKLNDANTFRYAYKNL